MSVSLSSAAAVEEKRRRLARLLEERAALPQRFPLSFNQQRLWFLDQLDPGSPAYQLSTALHLRGILRPAALEASLQEIVRRHKVLRTRFTSHEGGPAQIVDRHVELTLPVVDLSGLPEGPRQRELRRLVQGNLRTLFDLRHGHLFRGTLLRLGERQHAVLLAMHHIVSDGWSVGVIVKELAALYPAFCAGCPSPLPRLPLQYAEYAVWQHQWLTGDVLDTQLGYWKERLNDAASLELPTDHPRPTVQTFRGAAVPFSCPLALRDALASLGRQQRATLFMTLLAVFQTLLGRFSGQEDVSVGSPIANRGRRELELLIGFFTNTLVLRADLSGDPPFRELLARVRETALGAFAHQDMPLEKLVQEVLPERNLARSPLFQVLFALQTAAELVLELPDLALEPIEAERDAAKLELSLELADSSRGIQGVLEYNTDLFERSTAARLLGCFERLLEVVLAAPEQRLSELPLLSPGERHQILAEWNDTAAAYPGGLGLQELFEAQVRRSPEAVALVFEGEELRYGELNARANRLAHLLRRWGAGPGVRVGLCLERSPEMVVGLLAVLKAGGAYVPLDPLYPRDRLAFLLTDTRVPVLLTQERLLTTLAALQPQEPGAPTPRILCLDGQQGDLAGESAENPSPLGSADELAYVIYTSGSTGRPKGAMNSHRAICNRLLWIQAVDGLTAEDRVLQKTPFSFDISVWEFFWPLATGARLVLARPGGHQDPDYLVRLIAQAGITTVHFVPSMLQVFLEARGVESCASLRRVICSGEALTAQLARRFFARFPAGAAPVLYNLYGPTEAAVEVTAWRCEPESQLAAVPIGRPIANTQALVLDAHLGAVPIGVPGELYLGGVQLARGYLDRPDLTAERFLPDPFAATQSAGARLYRTGDQVRRLPGGEIAYLGRLDHQVKVRGHRIELGEIEAALTRHPGVREAVALVREDDGGDKRLVAYVVAMAGQALSPAALWSEMSRSLPAAMVPSQSDIVLLESLPLTANGKADRRALSRLAPAAAPEAARFTPPRGPVEEALAAIFAEVLKLERVGADDSFFEIGGHSLLAMQVVARVRKLYGLDLPVRVLFERPTVAALATLPGLDGRLGVVPPEPAGPVPRPDRLPLSFAQQRLWFLDQLEPGSPAYNIPMEVELKGRLNMAVLARAFGEVVRRHEALRTTFRTVAGEAVQVVAAHTDGPGLPVIDLRALPGRRRKQEVSRLKAGEARRPFDLGRGPLLRTSLLRLGTMHHAILVTMHHIVSDGWSMGLLVREVASAYPALLAGLASPLPELPMQYAGFAAWQRRLLSGEYLASELAWWRGQLAGMPPVLELPADRPLPAARSGRGGEHLFTFKPASLAGLTEFSRQHRATLFMTLLAGFLALLQRYTGEDDLAVGTPIAGRTLVELEPLIGLFVNTLVLRTDLSGDPEVLTLLDRVRETTLSAYSHQEVPFERLVEELSPARDLSRPPLVQVLFVVQNVPSEPLALPGLELAATPVPTATTKLDLTFTLAEAEGGLAGTLEYSLDLFDPATVERLAGHFTRLLSSAVAAPRRRLSELPWLSEAERSQLLGWNAAVAETRGEMTLAALFEAAVRRNPDAPALSFEDDTLSYEELNRHANRLAWRLRRQGVGPESRVAVLLDRSLEQVVALLGILKAGGAYVPFDPAAPSERLAFLCADSGAQVLVTDDRDELPPLPSMTPVVRLDKIEDELEDELERDDRDPPDLAGPENLCYVIYTSGSTGRPKGVMVRHGSVARLLSATGRCFGFGPADVWTLFHSYSFDFSVWELWGAFAHGGRLVVVPHWVSRSPEAFWWLLAEERVTVLNQTPAAFKQLVQADGEVTAAERARLRLRLVVFGGEALDLASLRPWYERHPPSKADAPRLVNMYGITETTVHVSYRPLDPADLAQAFRSPIGKAIPDLGLRVLSPHLELVPVGIPGEICVGGAGLARGYLGRPALTAERFVPDPFSAVPGERLYRSGDLGRYRPDGDLDYLGRRDSQVKVRGFRIEPGEIEAALLAHPGVRTAAVLPRQDASGSVALVAYVETAGEGPAAGELRDLLRSRLPEYMVPAAFLLLKTMPLTVNGKLDRKALAALPLEPGESADAAAGPRTRTEELVAGAFAEVLRLEGVGPAADFFALGGHSLLATQVASRLHAVFGVEMAVRTVFEAPTVEALASRIEGLLAAAGAAVPTPAAPAAERAPEPERPTEESPGLPLVPVPRTGDLPLSFAQQRLWFLDQLDPGSPLYNVPVTVDLIGRLDLGGLAATFAEVVRRHEALRTTFRRAAGGPVQVIAGPSAVAVPVIDLQSLPEEMREGEASRLGMAEARRPFDLGGGPLLRVTVLRLGAERHQVLLTMHHIVSDGWSAGVLTREIAVLYAAFRDGRPSPLPELEVQYADFAAWQRRQLSGERLASRIAYWRRQLAGAPPVLDLPTDRPRRVVAVPHGDVRGLTLPAAAQAGLAQVSRQLGVTPFMTLMAVFAALLQRYSGQEDLMVGTPVAGRNRLETERLIGLFVNTLAVRVDLGGNPRLEQLLGRVRETMLAGFAHQDLPFEKLVEELAPDRDLSRPPLVQVVLVLQNAPPAELTLPGLEIRGGNAPTGTAKFELTFGLGETAGDLAGAIEYDSDLYDGATIERMADHFGRLLAGAVEDPRRRVLELPLLSAAERRQLLGWNAAGALEKNEPETTLTALWEAAVRRAPEAPALSFAGETLSYGELDRRAGRLARRLRRLGVGPESRAGLLLERSPELVVGLLGILKAGGAYVPLDPSMPVQRLAFYCADSGVEVLVTDGREELPVANAVAVVRLGDLAEESEDDRNLPAPVNPGDPGNICYVIYTSGSTGQPKGVPVRHGSVARLLSATERWFGFGAADVWTLFHSCSFDFSVWELWGALAYGGRLVVVPHWVSRSPEAFHRLLIDEKVTVLNQTPSAFRQFIHADGEVTEAERARLQLRLVIFGGEALDLAGLRPWYERHAPMSPRLVNMYGITETTVHVSYRPLSPADLAEPHRSPIGVAIPDLCLRLLDAGLELVPVGVAGEICVGGAGLARGYLGRPELTAERFVPDPFSRVPGERLYRSGDLARYRPDGELDYLGRRDSQVKVRGHRIELGEIEAALLEHPRVRSAAVLPRQDSSGSMALVAFVETDGISAGELRERLRGRLPEYMLPAAFVFVASMPLTVNGKLDRKALAGLPLEAEERSAARPPRTQAEELVAGIFAEVLGLERVGAEESFFELGGHSLLATQVASRVRATFGVDLAVREVFEAPAVEALAARIESQMSGTVERRPAIARVSREGRLELSFAQQRLWFLDQLEPGSAMYNIPAAVRLTGALDRAALAASLTEIVRRHEALRTTFPAVAGEPAQAISLPREVALPLVDLAALPPEPRREETRRLTEEAARLPFDLARDPMLRVSLLALAAEEHVALAVQHHIVSDGWSIGVLTRELAALYAACRAGAPSPLPELAIQYADYAAWQRRLLSGERLAAELEFWRQRLAGAPAALELPTDRPRLPVASSRGESRDISLGGEAPARLAELSRRHGSTLFMTLLAGFAALLERHTGQETVVVGTPIAGRTTAETEALIGLFVNTLALRVDLSGSPDFLELLGRVRETALAAYAHQELPFERLVEEVAPQRDLSRPPLVQAMLVLQNAPGGALALPGLELEATPVGNGAAAFELTFSFAEIGGKLAGTLDYNRDLFDAATIERLAGHFERLLIRAVASPGTRLADLGLLSDGERQELLAFGTAAGEPRPRTTLDALFAAQVERTPGAPAVVFGGDEITYRDLDERVERWARRLRRLGAGPETIAGVCLEPSPDLVAALFAVWRAGGAFLPLDPAYPPERLAFMLEDSGAPLVLTRAGLTVPEVPGVRRVLLAELAADDTAEPAAPAVTSPEDLAYVIYTSGSTGRPKGVMVQQGEAAGHVESIAADWGLSPADRVLQFASPSFDTWIEETVPPLVSGAALVLRGTELWEPARFLDKVRELGLTVVEPPTAYWLQWVREGLGAPAAAGPEAAGVLPLRLVWTGGEAMPAEAARLWLRSPLRGVPLGNSYGPTEAIVTATCRVVDDTDTTAAATVSLGRPLAGRSALVLDRRGRLAPAGVPGELCLGGALLARGYLRRPDLTAERFVPDPFSAVPGGRLYRTGDLVRSSGGRLEYLGRIDQQVKVRGFRIELGEIEAALLEHSAVRSAVVLPRRDASGGGSLVAWVEAAPGAVSGPELRERLKGRLPEHMVPSAFGFLETMPLTPNGKVDRGALAALAVESVEAAAGEEPRTPVEELLAGIFAEVLKLERVGREAGFFELGGHSLLATQVVSRVRTAFGVELPVRAVFEAPAVAALASRIEAALSALAGAEPLPPITRVPRDRRLELSFAQQRLWFLDRLAPDNPFYNVFGAVRLTGALDGAALQRAFQEIVRRHEALRTTFRLVDGRPAQAIDPDPVFLLSTLDLEALPPAGRRAAEAARLATSESQRPFDLGRGPLLRAALLRTGPAEHTLLVNVHHIVSDGWSMTILFNEVATLYGAFSQGLPSPLPELPVQYADFAVWQRESLRGERLEAELDYWRRQLAGIPETLDLPADHPRPVIESFQGALCSFVLPAALVRELAALTRRHGATPSMTMLAGFKALLGRISGRQDVPVGVAIANRTRHEVESLIGFFVNTLVSRGDLSGSPGFARLLEMERETALGAYAHQDLPFERLVEELQPERDLSRNPLIQVMFGYQNFPQSAVEVPGLVLSPPEDGQVSARTAKFDLTLFLFEDGDRITGSLEYNSELFEAATMRRLVGQLETLLAAAVAMPQVPIALLPLLDAAQRHQLELEWNDTGSAYPAEASLQELFEVQVRSTPGATALIFDDGQVSYGELNRRANRLAHRLLGLGVGPESRVGLCVERSPEMIVGLLAILKAGGAYVPLDPDYPGERLAFMMEDSALRVLVGEEAAVALLPAGLVAGAELVLAGESAGDFPDTDPPVATGGGSLAYVIYTSGSTGRPKGVAVPHRAVSRLVREINFADFGPGQTFLQFAPVGFDASTLEIWGALLNGARLALMPAHQVSLEEIGQALARHQVTTLWLTAGLFHQLVEHRLELLRPVRQLLAGGDALSVLHVRRVLAGLPETRLINGYGPTENTTFTCCHPMQGPETFEASVPLGRPIANTRVHLLDAAGQPVPIGVAGELCAGGDGLARGYLGAPELTAERFVPNPFGGGDGEYGEPPGRRLYRTGDLARRLSDGRIEFLGRIDQQVKIRGFRIEPGEIEARLAEHPAVAATAVLAREDVPGDRRLVAYVVQSPSYVMPESGEQTEQVSQWGELFDDIYRQEAAGSDPTFNIIGWNSTYTDQPLPRGEMEDWLADTIGRILSLDPRRVLEIGCGTGMILFRIAPRCELYTGTDVSAQALGYVESQLGRVAGLDPSRVQLLRGSAGELEGVEADSYDTVIVNSVAQYFPGAGYLAAVVERAVELVRPGGAIFLGDLRSLPLLAAFHTSLELFQAAPEMPLALLRQKVQTRRQQENELAVDPAFFAALKERLPKIGRVEVYPKHGRAHNELTGYRYQVVLRLGEVEKGPEISWLDWQREGLTLAGLQELLEEGGTALLGLRNVPNARVAADVAAVRLLDTDLGTAGDLRRRAAEAAAGAVDPQDVWDLASGLPYEVELGWAAPGYEGCFDAVLRHSDVIGVIGAIEDLIPAPPVATGDLSRFTNNPLQGRFARRIAPELRAFLKGQLPDYMVPAAFVLLDALPLTANGKVDRRLLPAPDLGRPQTGEALVAPRNAVEETLVEIWRELLGVPRIGVDDDFFELGGHSLLATQALSRVREAFAVELPLRTFFAAPTVAAVALEVADLRLKGGEASAPPIVPVPRDGRLPLSFAQERLWFLDRLDTRTLAYNEAAAFRLAGSLDVAALRWSLDELLRRHESLRTTFPEVDGEAVQAIQPPSSFEMPLLDLRNVAADARDAEARRLALGQALHPFDLERGPLVRGLLMRLGETEHAVLFSFHHIVFDGWSTGIFVRELSALYGARVAGAPSPLPPLAVQYADFAAWQRRWLQGEALERQLAWWRQRLAGIAPLGLPADRPRPVLPEAPAGHRFFAVPPELAQRLRAFGRGRGATLFMTLLAAFQALLHRYTGQDDVAVGSPIANRNRGEVENLIGFFVNMLVLRTDLAGDPGFGDLVDRVREVALGAFAHQNLPFEKLVEELRPDRDLRRTPFFQASFQLLNVPAAALGLAGLTLRPWELAAGAAKFDLELALIEGPAGGHGDEPLQGVLDYDADLFDGATMERLLAHLDRLLRGALASPGSPLSELPLLTAAELGQVVTEWNDTRHAFPAELRLHEMFEAQARRTPEAVAVVFEGEELSYFDLNARANRLAHGLRRRGVGPGVRVGLCLERSPELVAGLLGVLKAGGAWVPMDPAHPEDRLAFMMNDARVPVLLTRERLLSIELAAESSENPSVPGSADELAYVIYTSGSTGRPKGVMNSHRGIRNRLLWLQQVDGLTGDDRVLQKTPYSFDVSVWEFFWPLITGARLVLARPGGHQDPAYLVRLIHETGITTMHFVPSMLQVFVEAADVGSCTSLRRVVCSGEALAAPLARRFVARFPAGTAPVVYNLYGPTEAAVEVTGWRFEPESPLAAVPIGRPVANTTTYVLDAHLRPVPIGIPGELFLGGVQIARGYLDRPELTAEKFIPDPFGEPGARLYRTGDQVRRLPGGEIVYLGRLDHQVKVRGFRIELGEIESALGSLAGVREAVVVAREETAGDQRLVAYVTGEADTDALRRQLRDRLPEFMVPSVFVPLAALPLNPSGKVDRKALPAPDRGPVRAFVAPRTPVEAVLAEIWQELLGIERVGVHDNFFELGGHSLLAVLLMARIEKRLGRTLPIAGLFATPSLESLAVAVSESGSQSTGRQGRSPLVAIKPRGAAPPFFCVHPVGGNVLCYLNLSRLLAPGQPFYALQSPDGGAGSVEEMAARYLLELRRVQPEGPYRLGGWSMGGLVAFEMARQLASAGQKVDLVAVIDTPPPAAEPRPPATDDELEAGFAEDLARLLGHDLAAVEIRPEDLQGLRPLFAIFAANLQASRAYVSRPYAGKVALYLAEKTVEALGPEMLDGWRALAGTEAATLPGDHYSLLLGPEAGRLAEELNARLAAREIN